MKSSKPINIREREVFLHTPTTTCVVIIIIKKDNVRKQAFWQTFKAPLMRPFAYNAAIVKYIRPVVV